jgi:putative aldouronate transport system substrate-binding protein
MKIFSRKGVLQLACLILVFIALVGCGNNTGGNGNEANSENKSGENSPQESTENVYKEKYDPPVTVTTVWGVDPALKFKNGESAEDNVATGWALDKFGIDIKSLWSVTDANGAFVTKMRLAMSTGEEMPDVITLGMDAQYATLTQDLIDSGMYREVGSLFDEYASETWKKAMNLDPNVWNSFMRDGKKMGIPVLDYAYNHDYLLWIRQDWLDKLDMSAPTNLEELEQLMDAFKNQNPDGLEPSKVIPLSIGIKNGLNTWMGDPSWVFGAYGTIPQQWNIGEDGKLEYGSINPAMKQGLLKLKEWQEKGYVPIELAIWDANKTAEPAIAGTTGIIPGPYWMSGWPLLDTAKNVEGAVWKPYPIPTGPDGKAGRHGTHYTSGVTLIHKDMEHPEALFTYQNYLFEHMAANKPGGDFEHGYFEGYDYALDAEGNPVYLDEIPGGTVNTVRYFLIKDGARIPDAQMEAMMNLAEGNEPQTRLEREIANNYGPDTALAGKVLMQQKDISFKDMYTGPFTETMSSKWDYMRKIEDQTFNEIIYGEKPIEAFDAFVKEWMTSGGEDITNEVNEWYENTK